MMAISRRKVEQFVAWLSALNEAEGDAPDLTAAWGRLEARDRLEVQRALLLTDGIRLRRLLVLTRAKLEAGPPAPAGRKSGSRASSGSFERNMALAVAILTDKVRENETALCDVEARMAGTVRQRTKNSLKVAIEVGDGHVVADARSEKGRTMLNRLLNQQPPKTTSKQPAEPGMLRAKR
jgi:hypothetical protein